MTNTGVLFSPITSSPVLLKVRAVELRECCFNISGCKLSALTVSAAYPDAVASVSDDELTDADFWRRPCSRLQRAGV
jgi:hypothetical protein